MASGTIKKTFHTGYTLQLKWTETATSAEANTSVVKVEAQLVTASGYSISSSASKAISITCDGRTKSTTCTVGVSSGSTKSLTTQTFTVPHNANGTKTAAISCTLNIGVTLGGTYYGSVTVSGNAVLTTLATPLSAPTSFVITAGHGNYVGLVDTITLKWSGASGTITGYDIQYSRGNSGWKTFKSISSTAPSGSTTDSFTSTDINVNGAGKSVQYRIRAKNNSKTSAWTTSNTLIMSGAMKLKVSGSWKTGSTWIKVNGTWKRAKRVWIKVNGAWKESK